jgi:hypothetical protein
MSTDTERLEWFFGNTPKSDFLLAYLKGIQEKWSPDQWRAAIDEAIDSGSTGPSCRACRRPVRPDVSSGYCSEHHSTVRALRQDNVENLIEEILLLRPLVPAAKHYLDFLQPGSEKLKRLDRFRLRWRIYEKEYKALESTPGMASRDEDEEEEKL